MRQRAQVHVIELEKVEGAERGEVVVLIAARSERRHSRCFFTSHPGIAYNRTFDVEGSIVFHHACKLGCEDIVSKRVGSPYRSGRSADWIKVKDPKAPAVKREAEEDWGR